jgi:hypothetical protein
MCVVMTASGAGVKHISSDSNNVVCYDSMNNDGEA